jgi:hypothetical protein
MNDKKVDFFIIGAQKSGTTSLANMLAAHPEVCFAKHKEPQFFSKEANWEDKLEEYHQLFNHLEEGQILGEASTTYTFFPEYDNVPEKIHHYNPEAKLIYIVRDPVERIKSHYAHRYLRGREKGKDIEKEVLNNPCYVNRSRYALQLNYFLESFDQNQMLVLKFEEFKKALKKVQEQIGDFLSINPQSFPEISQGANKSTEQEEVPENIKRFLEAIPSYQLKKRIEPYFSKRIKTKPEFPDRLRKKLDKLLAMDLLLIEKHLNQ